jgi:hypothetical protein
MTSIQTSTDLVTAYGLMPKIAPNEEGDLVVTNEQIEVPFKNISREQAALIQDARDIFDQVAKLNLRVLNFPKRFIRDEPVEPSYRNALRRQFRKYRKLWDELEEIPGFFRPMIEGIKAAKVGHCGECADLVLSYMPAERLSGEHVWMKKEDHAFAILYSKKNPSVSAICDAWLGFIGPNNSETRKQVRDFATRVDSRYYRPGSLTADDGLDLTTIEQLDRGRIDDKTSLEELEDWVKRLAGHEMKSEIVKWMIQWCEEHRDYVNPHKITSQDLLRYIRLYFNDSVPSMEINDGSDAWLDSTLR